MKTIKALMAVSVLAAAGAASATTIATVDYNDAYTTYGYNTLTHKPILSTVYGIGGVTGPGGVLDETGGIGTLTLTTNQYFESSAHMPGGATPDGAHQYDMSGTLTFTGAIDYSANTFNITSSTYVTGACVAHYNSTAGDGCTGVKQNTTTTSTVSYLISLLNPTTFHTEGQAGSQPAYNKEDVTFTPSNYTGQPSAVPVPAAAWLFGSGLLGLVGAKRRRG